MGAKAIYERMFNSRIEPRFTVKYMDYSIFGDLKRTPLTIKNKFGDDIQCYFYFHEDYKIRRDLIIFSHGYGGGHAEYLKEIYALAKFSSTPSNNPPSNAPGIEPIPPNTAAVNALIPGIDPSVGDNEG